MSAKQRITTSSVQRPIRPRAATSRLFLTGARVFNAFFSMRYPFGCVAASVAATASNGILSMSYAVERAGFGCPSPFELSLLTGSLPLEM